MIIPVLHRVMVKPDNPETVTKSGIIITTDEKRERKAVEVGTIIAIGDTAFLDFKANVIPSIGDKVVYAKYSGKEVKDGEDILLLINDDDVICIIR